MKLLVASLLFSSVGIVILGGGFYLFDKLTPYDLWKQIVVEKNLAVAILVSAMTISIAMIISSAIHG
ncbi:MAG: DUF350 domain-containing protein [Bdellovibrionales bacterium]